MGKITCDICGTTYAETAPCCPICGNTRNYGEEMDMEDLIPEEPEEGYYPARKKEIFDFDEVNAAYYEEDSDYYQEEAESYEDYQQDYDDADERESSGPSTFVIILLTVLIASMLIAAGFIFIRFYLPNRGGEPTTPETTAAVTEATVEATTEPAIPCTDLVMTSGASAQLSAQGQNFLLHVQPKPADTTDTLIFTSGDEAIATVTEDGRITAVSEGETIIYIACGTRTLECPVVVKYVEDTTPPEIDIAPPDVVIAEDVPQQSEGEQEQPAETAPEADAPAKTDVVLKLKKTDVQLGAYRQFTLELDCDLKPEDVQWSSEHPHIVTVDEKGLVTSKGPGTTMVTVTYGDQTAQCMVRCILGL